MGAASSVNNGGGAPRGDGTLASPSWAPMHSSTVGRVTSPKASGADSAGAGAPPGPMNGWLWTYGGVKSAPAQRCWFELSQDGATLVWRTTSRAEPGNFEEFSLNVADVTSVYVGKPHSNKSRRRKASEDHKGHRRAGGAAGTRHYDIWDDDEGAAGGAGSATAVVGEEEVASRKRYTRPKDRPYTFTVAARGVTLLLQAPNAFELVSWLHALRAAVCGRLAAATGGDSSAYYSRMLTSPTFAGRDQVPVVVHDVAASERAPVPVDAEVRASSERNWEVPRHIAAGAAGVTRGSFPARADTASKFQHLVDAVATDDSRTVRAFLKECKENDTLADVVEAVDEQGDTPLIMASRAGSGRVLGLLLRRGARVNATNKSTGETALHGAAASGSVECIAALLDASRKRDEKKRHRSDRKRGKTSERAELPPSLLSVRSDGGMTPLHVAAACARPLAIEALLIGGGDAYDTDDSGWTIAHYAAYSAARRVSSVVPGVTHFDDALPTRTLAVVCDVAVGLLEWFDSAGNTPLHVAASYGWTRGVKVMLESAADPHTRNAEGATPVDLARDGGHSECALLLDYYRDSSGLAPPPPSTLRGASEEGDGARRKKDKRKTKEEEAAEMARILAVWDRFFSNAIMGVEAMAGQPAAVADADTDSSDEDEDTRLSCWTLDAKTEGVTWSRGHFPRVSGYTDPTWDSTGDYVVGGAGDGHWGDVGAAGEDVYDWDYGTDGSSAVYTGKEWHDGTSAAASTVHGTDWEEHYDVDREAWFYYNRATEERTWERPAELDENHSATQWEELYDEATGMYYYYNNATGDVTWERPEDFVEAVSASWDFGEAAVGLAESWNKEGHGEWRAAVVTSDGASATVTTWEAESGAAHGPSAALSSDVAAATGDWEAIYDEASGAWYWTNGEESVWDTSDAAGEDDAGWAHATDGALEEQSLALATSEARVPDALEATPLSAGAAYYASAPAYSLTASLSRGEVAVVPVASAATAAVPDAPHAAGDSSALALQRVSADGWEAVYDEDSQHWYYFNHYTYEVVWAK